MICENCGKEHDGFYGSGRFCCSSCRVSFTNKLRGKCKEETKYKISQTLHNKRKDYYCIVCGKPFKRNDGYNTSRKFCSDKCHNEYFNNLIKYVDYDNIVNKIQQSKLKNKTSKSKEEILVFNKLKEIYPDIIHQYSSDLYPFNCDFYVPSLDLYIEYNKLWTHGKHLYDGNNIEDLNIVNYWKSKNTKYYDIAIYTWTDLDVRKQQKVKENNLNHLILWNIKDVDNYIKKYKNSIVM